MSMDLHIKDVLGKYIKTEPVGEQYLNQKLIQYWKSEMPHTIVSRTSSIVLKKDELTIKVVSAPLRHELFLNRDKLIAQFNEALGEQVVRRLFLR